MVEGVDIAFFGGVLGACECEVFCVDVFDHGFGEVEEGDVSFAVEGWPAPSEEADALEVLAVGDCEGCAESHAGFGEEAAALGFAEVAFADALVEDADDFEAVAAMGDPDEVVGRAAGGGGLALAVVLDFDHLLQFFEGLEACGEEGAPDGVVGGEAVQRIGGDFLAGAGSGGFQFYGQVLRLAAGGGEEEEQEEQEGVFCHLPGGGPGLRASFFKAREIEAFWQRGDWGFVGFWLSLVMENGHRFLENWIEAI